jgi:hypothetical protein
VRHHRSRKLSQKNLDHNGLNLESYIKFDQEQITRKRVVFHSIHFRLDKDVLLTIQQAKETGNCLYISRTLLADLRAWALIDGENRLQPGLTFYTYYLRGGMEEALIRSVISPDGDIFHQIKNDCLERPNFCRQITSAHYWMIEQILAQLRLRVMLNLNQLALWLSLLITAVVGILLILLLIKINTWLLLPLLVILWLLQMVLQSLLRLVLPMMGPWAMRYVLSGLLSRQPLEKKIAKGIWTRLA